MSREFTLFLAIIILDLLLGALCLAIARSEGGSPAVLFWGWGLLGCALGFLLILFSITRLSRVAGFLGNSLLAWVPVLLIRGVLSHTRYHLRNRWIKPALVLIVSVLAYNNFIGTPHLIIDIVAPATIRLH